MAAKKRELADKSNRMLEKLRYLRETEKIKRKTPISTPTFHELANQVNATSREIFKIAHEQDSLGEAIPTGSESIDDVDKADEA